MLEIETEEKKVLNKDQSSITVDDVVKKTIKISPPMDTKRQDLQRGQSYHISGGDPNKKNQI